MSVNRFINTISERGGMSVSNQYEVKFNLKGNVQSAINFALQETSADNDYVMVEFCDEAQLPNINTMTGTLVGRYTGQGSVPYAHTPTYTEFQLGWLCDANMVPLKFLTAWHDYIIGNDSRSSKNNQSKWQMQNATGRRKDQREFNIQYPDDYQCDLTITKLEMGQSETSRRPSITYLMERAYPYAIDAVPLSYGNSQLTRVTATFQYHRHQVFYNNIRGYSYFSQSEVPV